jgi:5-methylcytosine-specific restriction endonuclease McrA
MGKACSRCRIQKDLEDGFSVDRANPDGRQNICRECSSLIVRDWKKANPEKWQRINARWKAGNPEKVKAADRAKGSMRRAAKRNSEGSYRTTDVMELLESQHGLCAYCGLDLGAYHIDHILPLSRGGSNGVENIALACSPCNLSKSNKLFLVEWHSR